MTLSLKIVFNVFTLYRRKFAIMEVDSASAENLPTVPSSQSAQPQHAHERSNFRRELYARSTDRSTVEDMADMVVHRYEI